MSHLADRARAVRQALQLGSLLRDAERYILTPARMPSAHVAVVQSEPAIAALSVLGDALADLGFTHAAEAIARFLGGLRHAFGGPRTRGAVPPTNRNWQIVKDEVDGALRALKLGHDPRAWDTRPTLRLRVERVPLDRGGYDPRGRYYGTGEPLYRIFSDEDVRVEGIPRLERWARFGEGRYWDYGELFYPTSGERRVDAPIGPDATVAIDTIVRARDARAARALVANELGVRAKP